MKDKIIEQVVKDLMFTGDMDRDVSEQAGLYFYYAIKWVEASKKALIAKAELDYVEARLKTDFRKKAGNEGKKITEAHLNEMVTCDETYRKALSNYIEAKDEESFWQIVKDSMKQKKDMIEAWVNVNLSLKSGSATSIRSEEIDLIKKRLKEKLAARKEN